MYLYYHHSLHSRQSQHVALTSVHPCAIFLSLALYCSPNVQRYQLSLQQVQSGSPRAETNDRERYGSAVERGERASVYRPSLKEPG
jgi:hypothetical protein